METEKRAQTRKDVKDKLDRAEDKTKEAADKTKETLNKAGDKA
jgi:hypothetical protein